MSKTKSSYSAGRAWLAGIMIVLGVVLTPVAILTNWAAATVSDTQRFVATLSPLASNPTVQNTIINEVTDAINKQIDIPQITGSLVTGLGDALNLPAPAKQALGLVKDPISAGVQGAIHDLVAKAVTSDAFQKGWTTALTMTSQQITDLLSDNGKSALSLASDGTLSLPLKPIIDQVKGDLVKQGVGFANMIPSVNTSITIAKIPELAVARVVYQVGVGVGTWLPWIVLFLFIGGAFIANKRPRATMAIGISVTVVTGLLALAMPLLRTVLLITLDQSYAGAVGVVYDALIDYMAVVVASVVVLGIGLIVAGWAAGPSETAIKLRAWANGVFAQGRRSIASTPGSGFDKFRHSLTSVRLLIQIVIVAGLGLWVGAIIPLHTAVILGFIALGALLFVALEVLRLEPAVAAAAPAAAAPAAAAPAASKPVAKAVAKPAAKSAAKKTPAKPAAKKAPAKKPAAKKPASK